MCEEKTRENSQLKLCRSYDLPTVTKLWFTDLRGVIGSPTWHLHVNCPLLRWKPCVPVTADDPGLSEIPIMAQRVKHVSKQGRPGKTKAILDSLIAGLGESHPND